MRELHLDGGPLEAVLLPEAGARLHRLRAFGHDLLRTPTDPHEHLRDPFFWGAYVMAPWCNRLPVGPMRVGSATVDLAANFADGTAIHGQVHARPWSVEDGGATLRYHGGGGGWPWPYEVTLRPEVGDGLLLLRLAVVNRSSEPMPAGLGIHPWWRRPLRLAFAAGSVYPSNVNAPRRPIPAEGTWDMARLNEPADGLDATWTELASPRIELAWPDLQTTAVLSLSAPADHVVVATPAEPDATALEVQTHAPDGLRRLLDGDPGAMRWLDPGAELSLELGFALGGR